METTIPSCPICYTGFDSKDHIPNIFPTCGHSFCSQCFKKIISDPFGVKCPLDKNNPIRCQCLSFVASAKNDLLIGLLEKEQQPDQERCEFHNKKTRFICLDNKQKLCKVCFADHKSHRLEAVTKISKKANTQRKEVLVILEKVDEYYKEIEKVLDERKYTLQKKIKEKFQEMKEILLIKEESILYELESIISVQKKRLNDALGKSSAVTNNLKQKVDDLTNIAMNHRNLVESETLFNDIQERINKFNSTITKETIEEEIQKISEWYQEMSNFYEKNMYLQLTDCLSFDNTSLLKSPPTLFTGDISKALSLNEPDTCFCFEILSHLSIQHNNTDLVLGFTPIPSTVTINPVQLRKVDAITLDFGDHLWKKEEILLFQYLWSKPIKPKKLRIALSKQKKPFEILHIPAFRKRIEDLLLGDILCALPSLQEFSLDINNRDVTDFTLEKFAETALSSMECLEDLKLNLEATNISDEGLLKLVPNLKKLKVLHLNLSSTKVTEKALTVLTQAISSFSDTLEDLSLNLNSLAITDESLRSIFGSFPKIKSFKIFLNETGISDGTIITFTQNTLPSCGQLEKLEIYLDKTSVTDNALETMLMSLENIKKLAISAMSTKVTNKSLELFVKEKIPQIKELESACIRTVNAWVYDLNSYWFL